MTKKELKELIKEVISEETQSVDPEEILGKILELTISDTSDPLLILMKIRALAKNYFDKVGYKVNEAGGYKEAISEMPSIQGDKIESLFKTGDVVKFLTNPRTEHDDGEGHPNPKFAIGKIIDNYVSDFDIKELKPNPGKMHYAVTSYSVIPKVNEAGGYEDGIKDAKDRMKYVALRKMEKDHLAKSKITKDIKKQHHLDMADKYLQQALDIAKKHNVVD